MVSIIITTHNRAEMLTRAIKSVLAQTYQDWELIIVDDGSTDETGGVLEAFSRAHSAIRFIRQACQGQFAALNTGLAYAKGAYVAFLDDDDWWLPKKLEVQLTMLEADPALSFVYCPMQVQGPHGDAGETKPARRWDDSYEDLLRHNFIPMTTLVRRRCINAAGGFDRTLHLAGDYDLWLRIACQYAFRSTEQSLAVVRLHDTNKSHERGSPLYTAHVRIFRNLLANPLLPPRYRSLARQRLSRELYLLGRTSLAERKPSQAAGALWQALWTNPGVGAVFAEPGDRPLHRLWKTVKPYVALSYASLAALRKA